MKLITETVENLLAEVITEEASGKKKYYVEGICMQSNITNRNNREYPLEILQKEVARFVEEKVKRKNAFGELGHPDGPTINPERVSHMFTELRQEGNDFVCRAKIMDTPYGKVVQNFMDEGALIAMSSRGVGSVKQEGNKSIVQNDFYLATPGDIVLDPSAPNAFMNGILEGKEWVIQEGILVEKDVRDIRRRVDKAARSVSIKTEQAILEEFERILKKL